MTGHTFAKPMKAATPVRCPCGQWEWRDVSAMAAIGPMVEPEYCPKCRKRYLIVHRVDIAAGSIRFRTLGVVHLVDVDEACYRTALARVPGLNDDEIEFMVAVARLRSIPTAHSSAA